MTPLEIIQQVILLLALCLSNVQVERFEDGSISITACERGAICEQELSRVYVPIVGN